MRLTLRTLLAYLDDTLDAAEVKQIGLKVAESDTAQELIARIKQVTRRRRLTTPPTGGPGPKLDPNTIAEYLENKLSEDQVAEVEQVSLGSDVHLAELSACHQLLTLILGEPILIPPTSRQRMYALVKGREAIPFRKPRVESVVSEAKNTEDDYERDETLRLGLPAWRKGSSWSNRLTLIGGTVAACLLLAVAIWQATKPADPQAGLNPNKTGTEKQDTNLGTAPKTAPIEPTTGADKKTTGKEPVVPPVGTKPEDPKVKPEDPKTKPEDPKTKPEDPKTKPEDPKTKPEDPKIKPDDPVWKPLAVTPPSKKELEVGKFERLLPGGDPDIFLQKANDGKWKLVSVLTPKVYSGMPIVSLPGFQSTVSLKNDALQLKLLGAIPEESPDAQLVREAVVELHHHDKLDLDLTLHRGKIILTNRQDKPAQVRLRFNNPTDPEQNEVWDLLLKEKGTEVFIERWTMIPPGEPFYQDLKQNSRKGPLAAVHLVVREGKVILHREELSYPLQKPPGDARFYWVSITGVGKEKLAKLPEYASDKAEILEPVLPADVKPEIKKQIQDYHKKYLETRQKMIQARKKLMDEVVVNADKIPTVLKSLLKSDNVTERILAARCYGALDQVDALIDALGNKQFIDVRRTAIDTLRRWLSFDRDHDELLYKRLTENALYSTKDASGLITMLHGFSAQDTLTNPLIYEPLIKMLNHDKLALRELAGLQLYLEFPRNFPPMSEYGSYLGLIQYDPDAPEEVRQKAVGQWMDLLKKGKLPPKGN